MKLAKVNLTHAFAGIDEFWSPRVGGDIGGSVALRASGQARAAAAFEDQMASE